MLIKYPRTFHVPWSLGKTDDDKTLKNMNSFVGKRVIVTEKIDGENSTLYPDHLHARSISSPDHPSRHWLKMFHGGMKHLIPENWRLCGENVYALHSIGYNRLPSFFMLFSIWNEANQCLSWDETVECAEMLGVMTVPVLYDGIYDEQLIKRLYTGTSKVGELAEGYVIRLADSFAYEDFRSSVAKFVRKNHVQTDQHWMNKAIVANELL